jgi:hypothetical protein
LLKDYSGIFRGKSFLVGTRVFFMDSGIYIWYMEVHGYNPGVQNKFFGAASAVDGGLCRYCAAVSRVGFGGVHHSGYLLAR